MNIFEDIKESFKNYLKNKNRTYNKSQKWKEYHLGLTISHCMVCLSRNYKIYEKSNIPLLPEHEMCSCYLTWLRALIAGTATEKGFEGADFYLKHYGSLPDYYITKEKAETFGWKSWKGNLDKVAPNKMIGGNIFKNKENKLPSADGRIWFECDVDYKGGYRNNSRIVYSDDGLIFLTDSHYTRFIEIT